MQQQQLLFSTWNSFFIYSKLAEAIRYFLYSSWMFVILPNSFVSLLHMKSEQKNKNRVLKKQRIQSTHTHIHIDTKDAQEQVQRSNNKLLFPLHLPATPGWTSNEFLWHWEIQTKTNILWIQKVLTMWNMVGFEGYCGGKVKTLPKIVFGENTVAMMRGILNYADINNYSCMCSVWVILKHTTQ